MQAAPPPHLPTYLTPRPPPAPPLQVFVILFGTDGSAESQGIYSLRTPGPEGLPCETIVAFESRTDALRYCGELGFVLWSAGRVSSAASAW